MLDAVDSSLPEFLSKTFYPLLSTGSTQEDPCRHDCKIVECDVKYQNHQTNTPDKGGKFYSLVVLILDIYTIINIYTSRRQWLTQHLLYRYIKSNSGIVYSYNYICLQ